MKIRIARKILANVRKIVKDHDANVNGKHPHYGHLTFWRALVRMNETPEAFKHRKKVTDELMRQMSQCMEDVKGLMAQFGIPLRDSATLPLKEQAEKLEEIC